MSQDMLIFDTGSSVAQNESYPSGTKLSISACKYPWSLQSVRTGVDPVLTCVDGQWTSYGHGSPLCQEILCDMTDISRLGMTTVNGRRMRGFVRVGKTVNITCSSPITTLSRDHYHHHPHARQRLRHHGKNMEVTCFPQHHVTGNGTTQNWLGRFLVSSPNEAEENSLNAVAMVMNCP
eukprot:scpid102527/ scgid4589/ 